MLTTHQRLTLEYVRNSSGGATIAHFIDDYEPVGQCLWDDATRNGWVCVTDGKIYLTEAGRTALEVHA